MTRFSFDLNATRVRAVQGSRDDQPASFPLEPPRDELPLAVSLEGRTPQVGTPGLLLAHERPHLVCRGFLPQLGCRPAAHIPIDPQRALRLVLEKLCGDCRPRQESAISLPPYLDLSQVKIVAETARQAKLPLCGTVSEPLAVALGAQAVFPWSGSAVVIDVDDHALWISVLREADGRAAHEQTYLYARLGLKDWKARLLNALADCCIFQSRRDPRQFPAAEKALALQLELVMESCVQNRPAQVSFQTANWYQNLLLQPEETEAFCAALVRPVLRDVQALFRGAWPGPSPSVVFLTAQAAMLPGLAVGLEDLLDRWFHLSGGGRVANPSHETPVRTAPAFLGAAPPDLEDFGANLLDDEEDAPAGQPRLVILPPDAAARGAYSVLSAIHNGALEPGHHDSAAPLPEPASVDAGPARLHFQGRDYLLTDRNFTLGRRDDCDLVLDRKRFPNVSPWHCEIVYDPRRYFLKDLSREGTWLNDRPVTQLVMLQPGDRIRLGPDGPVIRYFGRPGTHGMTTTA